jgi:hypothetical protein
MSQEQSFYEGHSFYEGLTWWFIREQIGHDLRKRYGVPNDLSPELLTLVTKLDAIEGNQLLSHSGGPSDHEQMLEARTVAGVKAFPDWFVLT